MINPMELTGKRILVTGASSGIGQNTGILLSKLGAELVLVARNNERLQETLSMLNGEAHASVSFDLSNIDDIKDMMDYICMDKKLDGVVYSAGIAPIVPVPSINYNKMLEIMTVNYFAFMEIVKLFSKRKYSNGGSIVAVSSVSSYAGWRGASLYCGSKAAIDGSIRALAIELSNKGIRVNSVVPSNIKTKMLSDVTQYAGEEELDVITARQPLGLGNPDDVANAIAFLLSDAARFITGSSLVVDGGYLAQ
ncbi:MAG: SDR family oxidoreductase [Tissierellia bacterium]|nr:SDR family oxidoreductase [Tissierellia bacterium]